MADNTSQRDMMERLLNTMEEFDTRLARLEAQAAALSACMDTGSTYDAAVAEILQRKRLYQGVHMALERIQGGRNGKLTTMFDAWLALKQESQG